MQTNRGLTATIAAFVIVISGCTTNTYQTEDKFIAAIDTSHTVTGNEFELSDYQKDFLPEPIIGDEIAFNDVSQLDFRVRNDLGFPRIERILSNYEQLIKRYANRYGFDWRFVLAVMNQESRFRVQAVSHRGAYGLMQIMPTTGRDVSSALGIDGVHRPEDNIAGGVYYLWRVQSMFNSPQADSEGTEQAFDDRLWLSLAAYNAGPTRVRDAQRLAVYLGMDPHSWEVIRDLLPMLSRRYYTLHQYVWENGRPAGGYFYGWPETINYVESVMEYYTYYKLIFDQS